MGTCLRELNNSIYDVDVDKLVKKTKEAEWVYIESYAEQEAFVYWLAQNVFHQVFTIDTDDKPFRWYITPTSHNPLVVFHPVEDSMSMYREKFKTLKAVYNAYVQCKDILSKLKAEVF